MKDDFISRSEAVKEVADLIELEYGYAGIREDLSAIFAEIPAVDAVPVVHGRWIEDTYSNGTYDAVCSVCGESIKWNGCMYNFNYCPNCGAKMDEGKGE